MAPKRAYPVSPASAAVSASADKKSKVTVPLKNMRRPHYPTPMFDALVDYDDATRAALSEWLTSVLSSDLDRMAPEADLKTLGQTMDVMHQEYRYKALDMARFVDRKYIEHLKAEVERLTLQPTSEEEQLGLARTILFRIHGYKALRGDTKTINKTSGDNTTGDKTTGDKLADGKPTDDKTTEDETTGEETTGNTTGDQTTNDKTSRANQ